MGDKLLFLSAFMKYPKEIGSVAPSSKFLTKEIIKNIDFKMSRDIIELGPGSGAFTKVILKKAKPNARLFCFEINKNFCSYLNKNLIDKRLVIINAGAEKISENLKKLDFQYADCIVSGLPFLNFSKHKIKKILEEVKISLNKKGKFILFQYTNGLSKTLETYFSKVERKFVTLNAPPCFVYVCDK